MNDCWVRRSWLAHCAYVAELEAEHATIAARADQQHVWVMIGDDIVCMARFRPPSPIKIKSVNVAAC